MEIFESPDDVAGLAVFCGRVFTGTRALAVVSTLGATPLANLEVARTFVFEAPQTDLVLDPGLGIRGMIPAEGVLGRGVFNTPPAKLGCVSPIGDALPCLILGFSRCKGVLGRAVINAPPAKITGVCPAIGDILRIGVLRLP